MVWGSAGGWGCAGARPGVRGGGCALVGTGSELLGGEVCGWAARPSGDFVARPLKTSRQPSLVGERPGYPRTMSVAAAQAEAFYTETLRGRVVWGVRDEGGFPAPKTTSGHRAMPFWSKHSRAERIIAQVPAYAGMEPVEVSFDDWCERWLPDLEKDGILVGLNWSGKGAVGYDLPVSDLLRNLAVREQLGIV